MSEYNAPLEDMRFVINHLAGLGEINQLPDYEGAAQDIVDPVMEEAAKLAGEILAPLNAIGDAFGARVEGEAVVTHEGFKQAYQQFVEGGWPALSGSPEYDGMGLPALVSIPVSEMWQSANTAFSLCPMLSNGAAHAIKMHASDVLKQIYLPKMVSGEWTGTMNLTEPQAGSDLAAVKVRAVPEGDHYRITGTKIFITWGDNSFTENIIHLVLARLPDAPEGSRGISLFLVPKYLVNADGSLGERNDVFPVSVEHKMGIHASPTCVMSFGEDKGAIGYLVGLENEGLARMFTMMNEARMAVGMQGVAISERALQQAVAFAKERVQGGVAGQKGSVAIINHPDVRRMLMLMKSMTEAMRAVGYCTAAAMDIAQASQDEDAKRRASRRVDLMIPIVKGWFTENSQEITSLNVQVHGGMGYIEETGAAQHMRDARILPIYEGTTGIQGMDLVGRKIMRDNGLALMDLIADMKATEAEFTGAGEDLNRIRQGLAEGISLLEQTAGWLLENLQTNGNVMGSVAVNVMMLAGVVSGAWQMARAALISQHQLGANKGNQSFYQAKIVTAKFYMDHILPRAAAYLKVITAGSDTVMALSQDQF